MFIIALRYLGVKAICGVSRGTGLILLTAVNASEFVAHTKSRDLAFDHVVSEKV